MSAAKKKQGHVHEHTHEQGHEHADGHVDNHVDEQDDSDERRTHSDSQSRDRRVIPRLSHAEIRKNLRYVARLCSIAVFVSAAYIVGLIARHLQDSKLELNRSIFFGVVITIVAGGFAYLGSALKSYVENESQQRMVEVTERLFKAFFLFIVTGIILAIVNAITWF